MLIEIPEGSGEALQKQDRESHVTGIAFLSIAAARPGYSPENGKENVDEYGEF